MFIAKSFRPRSVLLSSAAAVGLIGAGAAHAEIVGTAGAVNPASNSIAPGAGVRIIQIGAKVVHKERVQTSDKGSVQLVFIDKTSISIGPNSDIVIDEFVYDPNTGTGRMAATLTKGVLRFVGGNTSHTGGATLRTPAATLGIRGGMNTTSHDAQAGTRTIHHFGKTTVDGRGGTQETLVRPDFGMTIGLSGEATRPTRVAPSELAALASRLTSGRGQSGGAPRKPTPQAVAQAGVGQAQAALDPPSTPSLQGHTATATSTNSEALEQQTGVNQAVQQGSQSQATQETAQNRPPPDNHTPPPPPPPPPSVPERWWTMSMSMDPSLSAAGAPYLHPNFVAPSGLFYNSPVYGYSPGGTLPGGSFSRLVQAGLNINGTGSSQVSTFFVASGGTEISSIHGHNVWSGGFSATTRRNSTSASGVAVGPMSAFGSDIAYDGNYSPVTVSISSDNIDNNDNLVPASAFYFAPGSGSGHYSYKQTAERISNPPGLGSSRPVQVMQGFAAGLMTTYSHATGTEVAPTFAFDGVVAADLAVSGSSRMGMVIGGVNLDHHSESAPGELEEAMLYFGSHGPSTSGNRGAYIDYDNFGGRETNVRPHNTPMSQVNGATVTQASGAYASSKLINAQALTGPGKALAGVTLCTCEYTRWGFWSSATTRPVGSTNYEDRLHLGTWVMGLPTNPVNMPTTGAATFTGHVIASIKNGASEYIAGGNLVNTVDFNTRSGAVTVTNLDGYNYAGTVNYAAGSNVFASPSPLTSGPSNPTMHMKGMFFDGAHGPASEMGGSVSIQGTNYRGAGTFAASR